MPPAIRRLFHFQSILASGGFSQIYRGSSAVLLSLKRLKLNCCSPYISGSRMINCAKGSHSSINSVVSKSMESSSFQKHHDVLNHNHNQDKNDTPSNNNKEARREEGSYINKLSDNPRSNYERAVYELHNLMSNSETVARSMKSRADRQLLVVPNMNRFIRRSGLTENDIDELSFIHVSGTKGKGSTCAFVERILNAKGYKTGLFSSPHLVEVRERFRINGRPISREAFVKHFWKVYSKLRATEKGEEEDMPAYFAFNVILGLHIFRAEEVDVVIMEVGIGGQYDSTNFIRHPAACGVTSLGLDHTSLLGNTLEEIAWNKAGIFKTGRPAMTVLQSPSCMDVLVNKAKERQSPFHYVPEMPQELLSKGKFHLGIAGSKQIGNASLALQLARTWEKTHHKDTLPCNIDDITSTEDLPELKTTTLTQSEIKGLSSCVWPGRAQSISRPGITYYLDGAHTKESMEVCSDWFNQASREEENFLSGKVVRLLLFNMTGDRNITALLTTLKRMCAFDAAVFSTNAVSTVSAHNVADQTIKGLTKSDMIRKAEFNKAHWDSILAADDESPSSADNNNSCECVSQDNHKTLSKASNDTNGVRDNGCAAPPAKVGRFATDADSLGPRPINLSTEPSLVAHNATKSPSDSTTTATTQSSLITPLPSNSSCSSSNLVSSSSELPSNHVVKDRSRDGNKDDNGFEDSKAISTTKAGPQQHVSCSFPCVLHALSWATQLKDPGVKVVDPDATLPPIPTELSDADHTQILVTGSLHLVGAALAVLDPNMND